MTDLWVEKYRPRKIEDYVFKDENQKNQILQWIERKSIPHLLLSGNAGIGKTSLTNVLFNELGVDNSDILKLNASNDNSVETIRQRVVNFASMMPFGDYRYVLLDEADYLSVNAQATLRGTIEDFSSTCRFILTCNYPNKIIPPLHSRTQGFHLESLDTDAFYLRVAQILLAESIEFESDVLDMFVKATYPDLRKCLQNLQQNSTSGKLIVPSQTDSTSDYKIEMINLFKQGKINEARKLICSQARAEEAIDLFKFLYQNIELFAKDEEKKDEALLIIRDGLYKHSLVADWEINFSATLTQLKMLGK